MAFLSSHLPPDRPHSREDVDQVEPHILAQVEADSYWCLSKLIDSIQDHYTFAQPGIQRMVFKLKELVARIDPKLHNHLVDQGLHFIQFAFRWMNCLLMRELSLDLILRVWDTYLAEHGGTDGDGDVASDSPSDGLAVRPSPLRAHAVSDATRPLDAACAQVGLGHAAALANLPYPSVKTLALRLPWLTL